MNVVPDLLSKEGLPGGWPRRRGFSMNKFVAFLRDESGASAAEYALILAIVGAGIAVAALYLGGTIGNAVNDAGKCIATPSSANCS